MHKKTRMNNKTRMNKKSSKINKLKGGSNFKLNNTESNRKISNSTISTIFPKHPLYNLNNKSNKVDNYFLYLTKLKELIEKNTVKADDEFAKIAMDSLINIAIKTKKFYEGKFRVYNKKLTEYEETVKPKTISYIKNKIHNSTSKSNSNSTNLFFNIKDNLPEIEKLLSTIKELLYKFENFLSSINKFSYNLKDLNIISYFCALLFSARRKMLRRVLTTQLHELTDAQKQQFWETCATFHVREDTRPDAISPTSILSLYFLVAQLGKVT
jgi:hypothetical protein